MLCPQIYLGPGRYAANLPPDYANAAIQLSEEPIGLEDSVQISVLVNNHGDESPPTSLELFWTDPSTGCIAYDTQRIDKVVFSTVLGASVLPPAEGAVSADFNWSPGRDVIDTNGGYICLLARLSNLTAPGGGCQQQMYDSEHPATDPLSALYTVQVVISPPDPVDPRDSRESAMYFAFAASNTLPLEDTRLEVRVLDPEQDRAKLAALVARPSINRTLSCRNLKFALPNGVQIAEGRESVIATPSTTYIARADDRSVLRHASVPRISRLGALTEHQAKRLLLPKARFLEAAHGPIPMNLLQGEQRQTFVRVEPGRNENVVYAVEVTHTGANGHAIGGLILLFVPPHNYF